MVKLSGLALKDEMVLPGVTGTKRREILVPFRSGML